MLGAFLTTICFSLSAIFANRSIRAVGLTRANLGRLIFALLVLGLYAHTFGQGLSGAGLEWFLLSGVIGMGLGDLALFYALPLLGSRLSILITQCLAAPIAILAERLWLGTTLTVPQLTWGFVTLGGVAVALMPSRSHPPRVPIRAAGFVFGLLSALGQGLGAVLTRKANALATLAGENIDGITAAYQRIAGGLLITVLYFAARALLHRNAAPEVAHPIPFRSWLWVPANAFCGAVLGVSAYQWALATTPSGIVLPIVACTPLVVIPFSYWIENERPSPRSLLGGALAVAGCIALALTR